MLSDITFLKNHRFTVDSCFARGLEHFSTGTHKHDTYEIYYVVSGKVKFICADKQKQNRTEFLKNNDLVFIDSSVPHLFSIDKESQIISLELRALKTDSDSLPFVDCFDTLCHCNALLNAFNENNYIFINDFMFIKQSLTRLQALINSDYGKYSDNYFAQLILSEIILSIDECYKKPYLTNPYINLCLEYITRNYSEALSVEVIAKAVNLNPSYLQKIFTKETGNTLFDYITQYRITKSIALMRNTNLAFADIAAETGFNTRQTFYNAFKSFTGYSPKLYKKYLSTPESEYPKK